MCSCSLLLDEFTGRIETNGKKPCSHFQHHPWVIIGYLFRFSSIPSFYRRHIFKRCHPFGASRCKNFDYNKWFSHFFRCTRVCVRVPQAFTWKLFLCSGLFFTLSAVPLNKYHVASVISLFANFISTHTIYLLAYRIGCAVQNEGKHSTASNQFVLSEGDFFSWLYFRCRIGKEKKPSLIKLWKRRKKHTKFWREKANNQFRAWEATIFHAECDKIDWKMIYLGGSDNFIGLVEIPTLTTIANLNLWLI